jgi:hypothetical protein
MDTQLPNSVPGQRVAQYVRMSTEHQQYSTENQAIAILQYAHLHGMEIVRTYADHGKSGLSLEAWRFRQRSTLRMKSRLPLLGYHPLRTRLSILHIE